MGGNRILCRCGYEHNDDNTIEFRRDAVSNRIKLFCKKCGKRLFPEYITTSSREFREIFSGMTPRITQNPKH